MRYTRFTGTFVLHRHIHEDQGMMQLVKIIP
jgi:Icc-related predicted phosphoesterase